MSKREEIRKRVKDFRKPRHQRSPEPDQLVNAERQIADRLVGESLQFQEVEDFLCNRPLLTPPARRPSDTASSQILRAQIGR